MMNREQIENEIEKLLADFTEQFERAKNFKSIPQVELDIMLTTVREMYQQLYHLNKPTTITDGKAVVTKTEIVEKISPVIEPVFIPTAVIEEKVQVVEPEVIIENVSQEVEVQVMPMVEVDDIIANEPSKPTEATAPIHLHQQEQVEVSFQRETIFQEKTKTSTKSVASLFDDTPTIGDHYTEQQSLHHKIGNTKAERLSDKFQQPVGDLKRSIGINEKFAFMNELFGGNQQHYNEVIEKLNNFSDYNAAHLYLEELASSMKWNTTSGTYMELAGLIKRRFDL